MHRVLGWALVIVAVAAGTVAGQDDIRRGVIKKIDAAKNTITLTVDGKDIDVMVTDETRFFGLDDEKRKEWDKHLKTGTKVVFKSEQRDGKEVLIGLKHQDGKPDGTRPGLPEGIREGVVKKIDASKSTITLTVDGKDVEVKVTDDTHFLGLDDEKRKEWDKHLKTGTKVMFKSVDRDGQEVLVGLKPQDGKVGGAPGAPDGIRTGVVKKVDGDKSTITLTVDGKDIEVVVTDRTHFLDLPEDTRREWAKQVKVGAKVMFKSVEKDGKNELQGMKLGGSPDRSPGGRPPLPPADTSKLVPLSELGTREYKGFPGGLYPDGKNERPAAHEAAGKKLAAQVQPLDWRGKPSDDGKIVLLSIGMSNTTQEFSAFKRLANPSGKKNLKLQIVDGAQGSMTAARIADPESPGGRQFWTTVEQRLRGSYSSPAQVQVAWIKEADAGPHTGFPDYARTLQGELRRIVQHMHERFPNLKMVYLSSRTYAGWARTPLNPEPYAYESGFSVKWLIEEQIKGDAALNYESKKGSVKAPWLSWGPYLWANGTMKRADGFFYEESDFSSDGTHPGPEGQRKVAELLLKFFTEDPTTKPWFVRKE
jgi:Cu/Ag efflux protein CusF